MVKNPKISIIIPVYNTEKYLKQCLNSLINQTYSNLEIICVNDGSTDGSLNILEDYSTLDKRVKVFTQENKGQSAARNFGIEKSTGDYLSFIDSDDWVYLTLYQTFVDMIQNHEKEIDIWMFNVASFVEGQNDIIQKVFFESSDWNNHISDNVIHTFDDCKRPFSRNLSVANKIYRKEFLQHSNLVFPIGLKYEDQYYSLKAFLNADTIMFMQDVFYRYRNNHETSISCQISEKVFDIFKVVDLIEAEIDRLKVYDSYKYALFQYKYNVFVQHYIVCPQNLRDTYYTEMKSRLLAASSKNLDTQIVTKLSNYAVFEIINKSNRKDFDAIINLKN